MGIRCYIICWTGPGDTEAAVVDGDWAEYE